MATIPQIAMGFRQPEVASPLNMMAQLSQMQALQEANALRQAQTAKIEREAARENQLAQLLSTGQPLTLQQLARFPGGAKIFEEQQQALQREQQVREDRMGKFAQALHNIRNDPSLDTFSRTWQYLKENKLGEGLEQTASQMMLMSPEERLDAVRRFIDTTPGMPLYIAKLDEERAKALKTGAEARKTVAGARIEEARLGGMQGGMTAEEREKLVPASIRETKWFQNATPEEKAAFAASQSVKRSTTTVNIEDKAGIAPFITSLARERDAVRAIPNQLENIQYAKSLIPEARAFMGPGGEPLLQTAGFLKNRLGFQLPGMEANVPAEKLRSALFEGVLQNLRQVDAQPTQKQQDALQAAIGKIGTDPDALGGILDQLENKLRSRLRQFNKDASAATASGFKFPFPIEVQEPTADQGAGGRRGSAPSGGAVLRFNERGEPIQ